MDRIKKFAKRYGRVGLIVSAVVLAFVLSIQFNNRGLQFDLSSVSFSASGDSAKKDSYNLSGQKIFNRVLLRLKDNYVKPKRLDPTEMLVGALDHLQHSIPEVVVRFVPGKDSPEKLEVEVAGAEKTFNIKSLESIYEMSFEMKTVFQFIESQRGNAGNIDYQEVEYAAINGMLKTLDPHSTLLPPRHYKEMKTRTSGEFGGLGIVISIRDGQLTVISPIDGTPAAKKGLKAKDKIVRIEDQSTINMNLNEAVQMLRGKPGTDISIWVNRQSWPEPKKITITRAKINVKSVNSKALSDKVGYLRIKRFQANTHKDLKKHLSKLKDKMKGMNGLVLDLRDNPGGFLGQAIKVADTFLEKGTVVSTIGAKDKMREKKKANKSGTEPKYPIVVLVNAGSASASEIVSGALQNHDRALVLGDKTFGKGTVQVMYEFPDKSALKLTVAHYLTPGGISIQSRGIAPDLELVPVSIPEDPEKNVDMFLSVQTIRERDLESHLSTKGAERVRKGGIGFVRFLHEPEKEEEFENPDEFERDFEIDFAETLVKETQDTWKRPAMLEKLQPKFRHASDRQMTLISEKLKKRHIDWSKGKTPSKPKVDFEILKPSPDKVIKAGETFSIKARLTNTGDKPLYRFKSITKANTSVLEDREFLFGKLEPGESKTWTSRIQVPTQLTSRDELIEFVITDHANEFSMTKTYPIHIQGQKRPQFAFSYETEDENKDGILQKGENVNFDVVVRNIGKAPSKDSLVYLKNKSGPAVFLETGRQKLRKLEPAEKQKVEFSFKIKKEPKKGNIELKVAVYDNAFQEFVERTISLPFSTKKQNFEQESGIVHSTKDDTKIYTAPEKGRDVAGVVHKKTRLAVLGKTEDWTKVDLGKYGSGWASQKDLEASGKSEPSDQIADQKVYYQAPSIEIEPASQMVDSETAKIEVSVSDDSTVRDYYVFVYHRDGAAKMDMRKLTYERLDKKNHTFEIEIPLFPEMNRVSVVARDAEEMKTRQNTYIYRKTEEATNQTARYTNSESNKASDSSGAKKDPAN